MRPDMDATGSSSIVDRPALDHRRLGAIAADLAGEMEADAGHEARRPPTDLPPSARSYRLLLETPEYDAWLIHWPPGTGLPPHDHRGSAGAFAVVAGELDEEVVDGAARTTRRIGVGRCVSFDGDHVHAVANHGTVTATSVHVYAPPLRAMGFYEALADGELLVVRVDDVAEARA